MSEDAMGYGSGPRMLVGRDAREPKTKVELARALGRAEERIDELELRHVRLQTEMDRHRSYLDEVEKILDGSAPRLYMASAPTGAHRLARHVANDLAGAKRDAFGLSQEIASIAAALDRGATLTRVGPGEGYVCERGLVRCTGPTPVAAAEAFIKADTAPAAEAKPQ